MDTNEMLFIFIFSVVIIATPVQLDGIGSGFAEKDANCRTIADSCANDSGASGREPTAQPKMSTKILACDFEVFGMVQGVFFRKFTQKQAVSLGLRGWCMNTHDGTVKGQLEGDEKPFNEMKYWLQTKGSPSSRIDKAVFSVPKEISSYSFKDFSIRR